MAMKGANKKLPRSRKGILLTLLTVVLFVLMLGEVITYVVINVNYDVLTQSASQSSTLGSTIMLVKLAAASQLHSSLYAAIGGLAKLENTPSARGTLFVNNTQYFIQSMMTNGMVYGTSLSGYMGSALIGNFSNTITTQLKQQGISLKLVGGNLTIFQGTPSTINASYSALAVLNTTSGLFSYPVYVTTSVQLNGTLDLSGAIRGSPTTVSIQSALPKAQLIGNEYAASGSMSPFMFAFGTVVVIGGTPTCANIALGEENANYILVTPNAGSIGAGGCGMGGVITMQPSSVAFNVPYLVYPTIGFNTMFANGTQILLDGAGLGAYNIAALQSALQGSQYFTSPYLPNYLDQGQSALPQRPNTGIFSFSQVSKVTPYFTDAGSTLNSNIFVPQSNIVLPPIFTISFWINKGAYQNNCDTVIGMPNSGAGFQISSQTAAGCAAGSTQNTVLTAAYKNSAGTAITGLTENVGIQPNTWTQAAVVFSQGTFTWYLNGNKVGSTSGLTNPSANANAFVIGGGSLSLNGSVTNVQVYNAPLSPQSIQAIYRSGISGLPTVPANVIAWYPLNGNANDYGPSGYNGITSNVVYRQLSGYYGDPIYKNIAGNFSVSAVDGALNCQNRNACTVATTPHLYLSGAPLESSGSTVLNESASFGLGNAMMPDVLSFVTGSGAYVNQLNSLAWLASAGQSWSYSIWVDPSCASCDVINEYNTTLGYDGGTWLEIDSGTGEVRYNGEACQSLGSIPQNMWTNIVVSFNGGSDAFAAYVNGVQRFSITGSGRVAPSKGAFYALGKSDATNCGSAATYTGLMSDYQLYSSALSSTQALTLYQNDTVNVGPAAVANEVMPLSVPYASAPNQTQERMVNNYGLFYNNIGICTVENVTTGTCGLTIVPP